MIDPIRYTTNTPYTIDDSLLRYDYWYTRNNTTAHLTRDIYGTLVESGAQTMPRR